VATATNPRAARSTLYRNRGGGRFDDVTDRAGVGHPGWGMGACVGDVDGDRRDDLYVTGFGGNTLYRNNGDGSFADITAKSGVRGGGFSTGCGFADYDRDGRLDLFVSRYVRLDLANLPAFGEGRTCRFRGLAVQCGPRGLPGETDLLFHQEADGRFAEVSKTAGVDDPRGRYGLGLAWFDYDEDGWLDLFVANDAGPNYLYVNQKDGTFREQGLQLGVAVSEDGAEQGSMGVALGAYDNSARFSLFITNFADEYNAFYRHDGARFTDVSFQSRTAASGVPYVKWGTEFLDYDNDGWLDLAVVNGHVYPQVDTASPPSPAGYKQRGLLYRHRGDGTFDEVTARAAPALMVPRVGRGLAAGDLDNDGRIDLVVGDLDGEPLVLRNETPAAGQWLLVALDGLAPNTRAIGAVVTVRVGATVQTRLIQSGTSYLSQSDQRAHFGVGRAARIDAVTVRWPNGAVDTLADVEPNQLVRVRQSR
jgi:hypothetical protein